MAKTMSKSELMETLAERAQATKKQVEDVLTAFENLTYETLKGGGEVTLTGFGTFLAKERHARMGVNPQKPNERIQIPKVVVPKFKAGKALKDALKGSTPAQAETPSSPPPPTESAPPSQPV